MTKNNAGNIVYFSRRREEQICEAIDRGMNPLDGDFPRQLQVVERTLLPGFVAVNKLGMLYAF